MEEQHRAVHTAHPVRRAKLLRILQKKHEKFMFWSSFISYSAWFSILTGVLGLFVFGFLLKAPVLLWISLFTALPAGLAAAGLSAWMANSGVFTDWIRFTDETLTLGEDALCYSLTPRPSPFVRRERAVYTWVTPYSEIIRIVYDRSAKTLRVYGRFNEAQSRKPAADEGPLPRGMRAQPRTESRPAQDFYVDLPLYYEQSEAILQELEQKTGIFVHPAMRGDDFADLRDLPGARKAFPLTRVMTLFLAVLSAAGAFTALKLEQDMAENPWQPYPPTEEHYLVNRWRPGDTVVLDGCRITVERAAPGKDGGMRIAVTWINENKELPILLRLDSVNGSIAMSAAVPDGEGGVSSVPCKFVPPKDKLVMLYPDGMRTQEFIFQIPDGTQSLTLELNSDRWVSRYHFWEPEYLGRPVLVNGAETLHNRVYYNIPLS